jgi:hypothetical protein
MRKTARQKEAHKSAGRGSNSCKPVSPSAKQMKRALTANAVICCTKRQASTYSYAVLQEHLLAPLPNGLRRLPTRILRLLRKIAKLGAASQPHFGTKKRARPTARPFFGAGMRAHVVFCKNDISALP